MWSGALVAYVGCYVQNLLAVFLRIRSVFKMTDRRSSSTLVRQISEFAKNINLWHVHIGAVRGLRKSASVANALSTGGGSGKDAGMSSATAVHAVVALPGQESAGEEK